jgi:Domain of unknown function (DUF4189)
MNTTRLCCAALCAGLLMLAPLAHVQAAEWGTIAFSPSTWATGWTANKVNEVDAELGALNNCAQYADDCITAINFHDACAAVAVGDNRGWGAAWGYDDADAQFKAIDQCSVYDSGCEILRWQCSW